MITISNQQNMLTPCLICCPDQPIQQNTNRNRICNECINDTTKTIMGHRDIAKKIGLLKSELDNGNVIFGYSETGQGEPSPYNWKKYLNSPKFYSIESAVNYATKIFPAFLLLFKQIG